MVLRDTRQSRDHNSFMLSMCHEEYRTVALGCYRRKIIKSCVGSVDPGEKEKTKEPSGTAA